jgi:hypothetical protein
VHSQYVSFHFDPERPRRHELLAQGVDIDFPKPSKYPLQVRLVVNQKRGDAWTFEATKQIRWDVRNHIDLHHISRVTLKVYEKRPLRSKKIIAIDLPLHVIGLEYPNGNWQCSYPLIIFSMCT